jgi:hypothetical protein
MRTLLVVASLLLAAHAWAVDYRWTTAFAQGTVEAIIRNGNGSSVNIYCPSGQAETTPGVFIEFNRVNPKLKEQVHVQFVVDGKNYPFTFDEIHFEAKGREKHASLYSLVDALSKSKGKTFKVEFSKLGITETFSLLGARTAFKSAKDFLEDCE